MTRIELSSFDLCFRSRLAKGQESNWIPADPKGEFDLVFRLGPEPSFFDKKWVLQDLEKVP